MKLLFDENLAGRLRQLLADIYPDPHDVRAAGLGGHSDEAVWAYAKAHGFVLVS